MHTRSRRKPRQNTLLFEELEPRLLFSADAAEALTGMAVEQTLEEEPPVAAAEEPAADSVDQSTDTDTPEPAAQPATPEVVETESPLATAPDAGAPPTTTDPALLADTSTDPALPATDSPTQPTATDPLDPVAETVAADLDQPTEPQDVAPVAIESATTGDPTALIDTSAATAAPAATAASLEPAAASDQPATTIDQPATATELVFVDGAVRDGQTLVDSLLAPRDDDRTFAVVVLDPGQDGIDQVSTALLGYDNLQAIHFLTHGGDGEILLGSTRLDNTSLPLYTDAIATWGSALADSGDILLYGCNIAASADGRFLVDHISQLTGADIAASTDATGLAALGGDWELEYLVGTVEATAPIDPQTQQEWSQVLAAITTGTSSSAGTGTITTATSLTWSHTIGSGSNGILLVNVAIYDDKAAVQVNSVTYGGTSLTRLGSVAGARTRAEMWYLKAPASGTANIVVTLSAAANFTAGATTFFNVDHTTPFGAPVTGIGSGDPSLTVASAPGELVVDVIADRDIDGTGSVTVGANQSPLWVQWNGNTSADATGACSSEAGAASVTMSWTTTGGGAGEWAAVAVSLKPGTNTAPTLDGAKAPSLNAMLEDAGTPVGAVGTLVSSLVDLSSAAGGLDNVLDPDSGALTGIAVTAANTANGSWWYSTNNGTTWNALGAVSDASARLLAADTATRLAFQPVADWNSTLADAITFRAWDQASGSNGALADTSVNGGSTAFSTTTDTAGLTVTPVNDAPYMPGVALGSTSEDTPYTRQVSWLAGFSSDVDAGALKGLAIVGVDNTNGTWQYTLDGTNWLTIGAVATNNALLLAADATSAFRFVPSANWNGTPGMFQYKAWDQTSGTAGAYVDASASGGTTAFSGTSGSALQVTAINDAPTALSASVSLAAVNEDTADPAGATVSTLSATTFSDARDQVTGGSSANTFAGVAVVANAASSAGEGVWQWHNGTTWVTVNTSVSTSSGLALAPDTLVRFLPAANYNGTPGALTVRLIDNSAGAVTSGSTVTVGAGGGTTAYSDSSNAVTLTTSITPVNDAPTGLPVITGTVSEDQVLTADISGLSDIDGLGTLSQ